MAAALVPLAAAVTASSAATMCALAFAIILSAAVESAASAATNRCKPSGPTGISVFATTVANCVAMASPSRLASVSLTAWYNMVSCPGAALVAAAACATRHVSRACFSASLCPRSLNSASRTIACAMPAKMSSSNEPSDRKSSTGMWATSAREPCTRRAAPRLRRDSLKLCEATMPGKAAARTREHTTPIPGFLSNAQPRPSSRRK
mmetsp:Transcript_92801/g.266864  ORF Transcript_92801/g.266864 Transcript_92801/m.266864 type:complete len:206 (-) Transcript_92801:447-1064(-)